MRRYAGSVTGIRLDSGKPDYATRFTAAVDGSPEARLRKACYWERPRVDLSPTMQLALLGPTEGPDSRHYATGFTGRCIGSRERPLRNPRNWEQTTLTGTPVTQPALLPPNRLGITAGHRPGFDLVFDRNNGSYASPTTGPGFDRNNPISASRALTPRFDRDKPTSASRVTGTVVDRDSRSCATGVTEPSLDWDTGSYATRVTAPSVDTDKLGRASGVRRGTLRLRPASDLSPLYCDA